jgi:formylglycine-generating enzyme required for sulfatase activity
MGSGDDENPDVIYERQVSGFYLDRFEVTVGRFAQFVD